MSRQSAASSSDTTPAPGFRTAAHPVSSRPIAFGAGRYIVPVEIGVVRTDALADAVEAARRDARATARVYASRAVGYVYRQGGMLPARAFTVLVPAVSR